METALWIVELENKNQIFATSKRRLKAKAVVDLTR